MAEPEISESRTLAAQLVAGLRGRGESVASAESLTGGLLAGSATAVVGPFGSMGTKEIKVRYFGDARARQAVSGPVVVTVVRGNPR